MNFLPISCPAAAKEAGRWLLKSSAGLIAAAGVAAAVPSTTVVISQVYGGGGNGGATLNQDFVELHNISSASVTLNGWSLQYTSATGPTGTNSWNVSALPATVTIPAGGYYLVGQAFGNGAGTPLPTVDATGTLLMGGSAGKVALVDSTTALAVANPTTAVDLVGYGPSTGSGATNGFEGPGPAGSLSATNSAYRNDKGSTDTDNNVQDFTVSAVNSPPPRNSATTPYIPSPTLAVASLSPVDNATAVPVTPTLSITFNKPISAGAGGVSVYSTAGNVRVGNPIPASSMTISGSTATFGLTASLAFTTSYYVQVDANAFLDSNGVAFTGILDTTSWSFTSAGPDTTGPIPVTYLPASGSTSVPGRRNLDASIAFGENITIASSATATLYRVATPADEELETIDTENENITYGLENKGAVFIFSPQPQYSQTYKIKVPAGAFTDDLGNLSAAIEWTFTTVAEPVSVSLTNAAPYTQDFATYGPVATDSLAPALPVGWSLRGVTPVYPSYSATTEQRAWGFGSSAGLRGLVGENVLGYQHTSGTTNTTFPSFDKILTLRNDTGAVLSSITVTYTGKVNRTAEVRSPAYAVTVGGVAAPGLQYSTSSGADKVVTSSVAGLSVPAGDIFQIVWSSDRGLVGTGSSKQIGLTNVTVRTGTLPLPPAMAGPTLQLETLTQTSFSVGSAVNGDNGSPITERGIVYSLASVNADPVLGGPGVSSVVDFFDETGSYNSPVSGLSPSTSYAVKAYAINANGTTYTSVATVTTLAPAPSFVTSYSQPFDNYLGVWPAGWTAISSGGVQNFNETAWSASDSVGGFYGKLSDPGLLGFLHTNASGTLTVKLELTNDTGAPIQQLFVSYLGRTGNTGADRPPVWQVAIDGSPVSALTYSTADEIDKSVKALVTGLNIPAGAVFTITWTSDRGANPTNGNGSSQKIGIGEVVVALEEPPVGTTGFAAWSATNAGGQTIDQDFDGDGIRNGLEYFFGATGSTFTPNPTLVNGTIKWPDAGVTDLNYKVQTSTDLVIWTRVPNSSLNLTEPGFIGYTPPAAVPGTPKLFIRFVVDDAPPP